jgi:hypothetical protein
MQVELTALKGQFALGPKLGAAAGEKDGDKKDSGNPKGDKQGAGKTKNKKGTANKCKQKEAKKWQMCASQGRQITRKESQGLHLLLVQAPYVLGQS